MKNVSNAFKKAVNTGAPMLCYADMVLADGTKLDLGPEDEFMVNGNGITESAGAGGFPLGCAIAKTASICLDNSDGRYSAYDFYFSRITVYTGIVFDNGEVEKIKEGTFTVIDSVTPGEVLEINAVNDMYKADVTYIPRVSAPVNLLNLLQDVCSQCGIQLGSVVFQNQDYLVREIPTGTTGRTVIGYIAQIAGGNACCDVNNRLIIKPYDLSILDRLEVMDGREFDEDVETTVDGGNFGDVMTAQVDAGNFGENEAYHNLYDWIDLTAATDDVVITGVTTEISTDDGDETYLSGLEGYTLAIDNPLIKGNEKNAVDRIARVVVGITIRPFSGNYVAYPLGEFMDACLVWDAKDNMYPSFLTDIDFAYGGGTALSNSTEPPLHNQSTYYSNATEAYRRARQEAQKQKTEWEKAMEDLSSRLETSSGLYTTIEKQADGSSIFYMHDKKTLGESMIVWKQTAEAWGVSTDGGKTWNAGMTVDGDVIARILNAIGINADWIRTGVMYSTDYGEGKSGVKYDLNNSQIISYYTNPNNGHRYLANLSESSLIFQDLDSPNVRTELGLDGISFLDGVNGVAVNINGSTVQISNYDGSTGKLTPVMLVSKNGIEMRDGTIKFADVAAGMYKEGRTGTAEFSDGTYMEFKNGVLVGGYTTGGAIQ